MIDWQRVAQLRDEVGSEDFGEVVEMFLDEVEAVVMRLRHADQAELHRDLHFLKGSAMNLGFGALATLCQQAETTACAGGPVSIPALVDCYSQSKRIFTTEAAMRHSTRTDRVG